MEKAEKVGCVTVRSAQSKEMRCAAPMWHNLKFMYEIGHPRKDDCKDELMLFTILGI